MRVVKWSVLVYFYSIIFLIRIVVFFYDEVEYIICFGVIFFIVFYWLWFNVYYYCIYDNFEYL